MKELLQKIIFPWIVINQLETENKNQKTEIDNQDKQYTTIQIKLTEASTIARTYEKENKELEATNTKHLDTLRNQRLKIKELEKRIKELENGTKKPKSNSKSSTRK